MDYNNIDPMFTNLTTHLNPVIIVKNRGKNFIVSK